MRTTATGGLCVSADVRLAPQGAAEAPEPVVGSFRAEGMAWAVTGEGQVELVSVEGGAAGSQSAPGESDGPSGAADSSSALVGPGVSADPADPASAPTDGSPVLSVPSEVAYGGASYSVASVGPFAFARCAAVTVALPASVADVDARAFRSSAAQRVEVDPASPSYASYDGALYSADLTRLLLIPGGRQGAVRILSHAEEVGPEAFSHCAGVTAISADAGGAAFSSWDGLLYDASGATLLRVPPGAESISIREGCRAIAPGALAGCSRLGAIDASAGIESVPPEALGEASGAGAPVPAPSGAAGAAPQVCEPVALVVAGEAPAPLDPAVVTVGLPQGADASPWEALGFAVRQGGDEAQVERASEASEADGIADGASAEAAPAFAPASSLEAGAPSAAAADNQALRSASRAAGAMLARQLSAMPAIPALQSAAAQRTAETFSVTVNPNGHNLHHNRFLYVPGGSGSEEGTTNTTLSSPITLTGRLWYIGSLDDMSSQPTSVSVDGQFRSDTDNTFWVDRFWDPWNTGYTLKGFNTTSTATTVLPVRGEQHGNVELFAIWEANKYSVSFNANGGSGGQSAKVTATYDKAMPGISTTKPTRTGYSFQGWYDTASASGGTQYYNANGASVRTWNKASDATLYARWKANTYTVTFNANSGSGGQSGTKAATYASAMPGISTTKPMRAGYTFQGWYDNANYAASGAKQYYKADCTSARNWDKASNATLYAGWKANTYTVSFNANGGSGGQTANVTATYGSAMPGITSTKPTRAGHRFQGWYDTSAASGGTQYYQADGKSARAWNKTSNATLYARWSTEAYSITVNPNGHNLHRNRFLCNATTDQTTNATLSSPTTLGGRHWYIGDMNDLSSEPKSVSIDGTIASDGTFWVDRFWDPWNPGYTLKGFNTSATATTVISPGGFQYKDVTLYAIWEANKYSVSFNANGGSGGQSAKVTATYDKAMPGISTTKPTRTGYSFQGWYDTSAASGGTQYYKADGTSARTWNKTADATFYARWVPNSYTVEYWNKAGTAKLSSDSGFKYDSARNLATKPTSGVSTGYAAVGWAESANQSAKRYDFGSSQKNLAASGTKKLYLAETANRYTVSFDAKGGTGGQSADVTATFGSLMPTIDTQKPTRTGYRFLGWYENQSADGGQQYYDASCKPVRNWDHASSWILRAKWEGLTYTVSFAEAAGPGVQQSDVTVTYGSPMPDISSAKPVLAGYTFGGWYDTPSRTGGTQYYTVDGKSARNWDKASNGRLYPRWANNSYLLSFDANGGTGGRTEKLSATYAEAMPPIPDSRPTRTGYAFGGWWDTAAATGGTQYYTDLQKSARSWDKASNATLYARWVPNTYTVEFDPNGGEGGQAESVAATFGALMPTIPVDKPVRAGYQFLGWYENRSSDGGQQYYDASCKPVRNWDHASDWTLRAKWRPWDYEITYDLQGGALQGEKGTYTIEDEDFALVAPMKAGYAFAGWDTKGRPLGSGASTAGTTTTIKKGSYGAFTATAKWNPVEYKVTVDHRGGGFADGTSAPSTYTIESSAFTLPESRRTGYAFLGWTGSNGTEPQKTVTIATGSMGDRAFAAQWEAIDYAIDYQLEGGSFDASIESYTIEDAFDLPVPTRYGYQFDGWDVSGVAEDGTVGPVLGAGVEDVVGADGSKATRVRAGTYGDLSCTARWTLRYDLDVPVADPGSVTFEADSMTGQVRVKPGTSADGELRSYMAVPVALDELSCEGLDGSGAVDASGGAPELEAIFGTGSASKVRFTATLGEGDAAHTAKVTAGGASGSASLAGLSIPAATSKADPGRLAVVYGLELDSDLVIPPVRDAAPVARLAYTVSLARPGA